MWFIDTPWPPVIIFGTSAVLCVGAWLGKGRGVFLLAAIGLMFLCGATLVLEKILVSDRERVEEGVLGISNAFQMGDEPRTMGYISKQAPELEKLVHQAFEMVSVSDLHIRDMSVEMTSQGTRAVSRFRANGTVNVKAVGISHTTNAATKWDVTWQKEDGGWKIIRVQRLDPLKNEAVGTFAGH